MHSSFYLFPLIISWSPIDHNRQIKFPHESEAETHSHIRVKCSKTQAGVGGRVPTKILTPSRLLSSHSFPLWDTWEYAAAVLCLTFVAGMNELLEMGEAAQVTGEWC